MHQIDYDSNDEEIQKVNRQLATHVSIHNQKIRTQTENNICVNKLQYAENCYLLTLDEALRRSLCAVSLMAGLTG